jgi:hypothetical protein
MVKEKQQAGKKKKKKVENISKNGVGLKHNIRTVKR